MVTEEFVDTVWANRVRTAVRHGLMVYLCDKKYQELDSEEKFNLMAEDITKRICHQSFWGTPKVGETLN